MKHFSFYSWLLAGILMASFPTWAQNQAGSLPTDASWLAQHAVLGSVLAAGFGLVLGAWLMRRWARKHYHHAIHRARLKAREEADHAISQRKVNTVKPPTDYELKLREENTALKQQVETLKQQLTAEQASTAASASRETKHHWPSELELAQETATLPVAAVPLPATEPDKDFEALLAPTPSPTTEPLALPATEEAMAVVENLTPTAIPVPSATRYAPAQETGFLRDNKLATEPLPQLPLLLTLCADDPDKAFFTLNPHVNQAKLIGDGLHQLNEFFDFDLPTGRIAAVSADSPGQLARQGDGWQVVSRARLLVH